MENQNIKFIKILQNIKGIRILFIVLNFLAWFADDIVQKDLINNKQTSNESTQFIYTFILVISIIVNLYYIAIIEDQIKISRTRNQDTKQLEIRKFALTILVIALFILFCSQSEIKK